MSKPKKHIQQMTITEWQAAFPDEHACAAYLVDNRWPEGVRCPRCGNPAVYHLVSRKWHWQCEKCAPDGYRFSHIAGTIFENTNKPLRDWFRVLHLMVTSKETVSAMQVYRTMGFGSYKTAWYMCHRLRAGMQDKNFREQLGVLEVGETFIDRKARNRHKVRRSGGGTGGVGSCKPLTAGAVRRKGKVVENVRASALTQFVRE